MAPNSRTKDGCQNKPAHKGVAIIITTKSSLHFATPGSNNRDSMDEHQETVSDWNQMFQPSFKTNWKWSDVSLSSLDPFSRLDLETGCTVHSPDTCCRLGTQGYAASEPKLGLYNVNHGVLQLHLKKRIHRNFQKSNEKIETHHSKSQQVNCSEWPPTMSWPCRYVEDCPILHHESSWRQKQSPARPSNLSRQAELSVQKQWSSCDLPHCSERAAASRPANRIQWLNDWLKRNDWIWEWSTWQRSRCGVLILKTTITKGRGILLDKLRQIMIIDWNFSHTFWLGCITAKIRQTSRLLPRVSDTDHQREITCQGPWNRFGICDTRTTWVSGVNIITWKTIVSKNIQEHGQYKSWYYVFSAPDSLACRSVFLGRSHTALLGQSQLSASRDWRAITNHHSPKEAVAHWARLSWQWASKKSSKNNCSKIQKYQNWRMMDLI